MWERQDLELQLEDECECQGKLLVTTQSCAAEPTSGPHSPTKDLKLLMMKYSLKTRTSLMMWSLMKERLEQLHRSKCSRT
jgi:hypothetical protein